jgi:predicted nucleic-acid-binding Zn-ribbon protein
MKSTHQSAMSATALKLRAKSDMAKCNNCTNTTYFVRKYIDTMLHIYDASGDEVDSTSIGYDIPPNAEFKCHKCGSVDTEEG